MNENTMTEFVAGWNMPGFLPDDAPEAFDSVEDAKRYLIAAALHVADSYGSESDEDRAESWSAFAEDLNLASNGGNSEWVSPSGDEWWIVRRTR